MIGTVEAALEEAMLWSRLVEPKPGVEYRLGPQSQKHK